VPILFPLINGLLLKVYSEVPKCENDEQSKVVDHEVGNEENKKVSDIPQVLEEKANPTAHVEEFGFGFDSRLLVTS